MAYLYNANGDMTGDGLRSFGHDAEGRLASVTTGSGEDAPTTRYAHNALGQRVFKTEPLYAPVQGEDAGFFSAFTSFISQMWNPATQAEMLGYAYVYDEQGSLIGEWGAGGAQSGGSAQYVYLPTAGGPMPVVAVLNGTPYAVHADHLNTPRRLTNSDGQPVWQWSYSAFGEVPPTTAAQRFADETTNPTSGQTGASPIEFNLRYPGQYFDKESGLSYNYFRSYDPRTGRYSQSDPIGLDGGWNRFGYVKQNPLNGFDPQGLQAAPTPWGLMPMPVPSVPRPGSLAGTRDPDTGNLISLPSALFKAQSWPSWPPYDPPRLPNAGGGNRCDQQYQRDSAICRGLPTDNGRAQCWESAADRLAACMAGKDLPPLNCN